MRTTELKNLGIWETAPEACFDELVQFAAARTGYKFAALNLISDDAHWAKARLGFPERVTKEESICFEVVRQERELGIPDLNLDERFSACVPAGFKRYAGVPLRTEAGVVIGTLCVADSQAGVVEETVFEILRGLAQQASHLFELRRQANLGAEVLGRFAPLKSLGESAAAVAHDIKNPLAIAVLMVQMLREQQSNQTPAQVKMWDKTMTALDRITELVTQVQKLAHTGDDRQSKLHLNEMLVRSAVNNARLQAKQLNVEIKTGTSAGEIETIGGNVDQILSHLMRNALEAAAAAKSNPWVSLDVEDSVDQTIFRVRDSGLGVTEALRGRIMLPFFTTKTLGHAAGLGLTQAQKLAGEIGGRVYLNTESAGTEFCLVILKRVAA